MSLIAVVLRDSNKSATVERLDVLVWNLANLFNRQQIIVDVGLLLKATRNALDSVELVVPFAVRNSSECMDLSHRLIDDSRAAETVVTPDGLRATKTAVVLNDDEQTRLQRTEAPILGHEISVDFGTDVHRTGRVLRRRERWSIVKLRLARSLAEGEIGYVRARFFVYGPTSLVVWKRSLFANNGAVFDIRTYAVRPLTQRGLTTMLRNAELDPTYTSISLVLRATLVVRGSHPSPIPSLLEQGAWSRYLERATDLRNEGALVLYRTDSEGPDRRGTEGHAGLFVNASREFGLWSIGNYLRVAVGFAIVLLIADAAGLLPVQTSDRWIRSAASLGWAGVGIFGAIGVIGLIKIIPPLYNLISRSLSTFARMERALFRFLGTLYSRD